jgi:hypothetical protein
MHEHDDFCDTGVGPIRGVNDVLPRAHGDGRRSDFVAGLTRGGCEDRILRITRVVVVEQQGPATDAERLGNFRPDGPTGAKSEVRADAERAESSEQK